MRIISSSFDHWDHTFKHSHFPLSTVITCLAPSAFASIICTSFLTWSSHISCGLPRGLFPWCVPHWTIRIKVPSFFHAYFPHPLESPSFLFSNYIRRLVQLFKIFVFFKFSIPRDIIYAAPAEYFSQYFSFKNQQFVVSSDFRTSLLGG